MPELTTTAKDRMLKALFGGVLLVALTRGTQEIADPGYRRLATAFGKPSGAGGTRTVENVAELRFGPFDADGEAVTGWRVLDGDTALASGGFEKAIAPRLGDELIVRPGVLVLGLAGQ